MDSNLTKNTTISYLIDQGERKNVTLHQCSAVKCTHYYFPFRIVGLASSQHTLSVFLLSPRFAVRARYPTCTTPRSLLRVLFSLIIWCITRISLVLQTPVMLEFRAQTKGQSYLQRRQIRVLPTAPECSTRIPRTQKQPKRVMPPSRCTSHLEFFLSPPSSALHTALAGGIVLGIIIVILPIAGVLWYYCFKKDSTTGEAQRTAPSVGSPPPSTPPPTPQKMGVLTYDPPGYTEKNAYFSIQSPLANHSALNPSTQEEGLVLQ
jgi:hypothetical protein